MVGSLSSEVALSSNNRENDLPLKGALSGELSTNEVSVLCCSSSVSAAFKVSRGNEMAVVGITRRLLSLLGDGDTGSPLSRLRARDTAPAGICSGLREKTGEEGEEEG